MENYKLINKVDNKLFQRKEITATVDSQITPSHEEVEKLLEKEFKTPIENIKLKQIKGKFGSKTFTIIANIYSSKKEKDSLEPKKKWELEKEKKLDQEQKAQEEAKKVAEESKKEEESKIVSPDVSQNEELRDKEPKGKETGETNPEQEPKGDATEDIKPGEEPK